ncbi:hypothetical protein DM860_016080 [Cuscuta australis]|uniref:Uncharacterized protein n=1 Tax=Cuscuta australis TaxID=267555 RepID=A0A328E6Y3_9ASTE|nr:hypothetical protein DM860_016080 [Cuscuta australis]
MGNCIYNFLELNLADGGNQRSIEDNDSILLNKVLIKFEKMRSNRSMAPSEKENQEWKRVAFAVDHTTTPFSAIATESGFCRYVLSSSQMSAASTELLPSSTEVCRKVLPDIGFHLLDGLFSFDFSGRSFHQ